MEYNNHECIEDGSSLHVLTESELNQIIIGEKTEEEIWQEKENFLKKRSYNNPHGITLRSGNCFFCKET